MASSESERACVGRPRRRTAITPIQNKNAREVSFTKRRQVLFRKASELTVLCGAEVAIITYSPHQNPFTFGAPSADAVLGRFLGYSAAVGSVSWGRQNAFMSQEIREALSMLGEAKKRVQGAGIGSTDDQGRAEREDDDEPGEGLGLEELEHYVDSMERLKDTVRGRLEETAAVASSSGSVEKEEQLIITDIPGGSTSSEVVDPDLDYMTVFDDWIGMEEEIVPRGNSFNYYNIWDHDFGLSSRDEL